MNRTFLKKNDEAVSPVIGVILMVAITVVLAAVVFVVVSKLANNNAEAPISIGVSRNSDNTFSITSIDTALAYGNLTIKDNGITQSFTVNNAAPVASARMAAGDVIKITGLTTGSHNVNWIYHNQVIYSTQFIV